MINLQNKQNVNFGWNGVTHRLISQTAVNKLNRVQIRQGKPDIFNVENIMQGSVSPDKEPHISGSHSADFLNRREKDAYNMFKKYEKNVFDNLAEGVNKDLELNIGRALHFLQDMMNTHHVIYKAKQSKIERVNHRFFEDSTIKIQNETIKQARVNYNLPKGGFEKLLKDKMEAISTKVHSYGNNFPKAKEVRQNKKQGLEDSYQLSLEFLDKVLNKLQPK